MRDGREMKVLDKRRGIRWMALLLFMITVWSITTAAYSVGATGEHGKLQPVLSLIGGALVDLGQQKYDKVTEAIAEARKLWDDLAAEKSDLTANVDAAFTRAEKAMETIEADPQAARQSLSELVKAVNAYLQANDTGTTAVSGPESAGSLIPVIEQLQAHVQAENWTAAYADFKQLDSAWIKIEMNVRKDNAIVYGGLETRMSMIGIALRAEPPRLDQAKQGIADLLQYVQQYKEGKLAAEEAGTGATLADAIAILDRARADVKAGNAPEASGQMNSFILMWPTVEGEVQLRSASVYTAIENEMTEASGYLLSNPPQLEKALAVIDKMKQQLEPLTEQTRYTAFDAGAILFREGLEAILIIGALLAYLHKTGNGNKRKWIWSGAGAGLLLSVAMAIVLTYAISQAFSGSMRENIEGFAGLTAVVFMLFVGNWLHNKSNVKAWNAFIEKQAGGALASGSLWSLFFLSLLCVFREGAETVIFYMGMAQSVALWEMVIGIAVTLAILATLAYLMITYSIKLPLRPFFLLSSGFIYLLVFRFIGESIHSLQVTTWISAHVLSSGPVIGWLGIYPTVESLVPQTMLLLYLLFRYRVHLPLAKGSEQQSA